MSARELMEEAYSLINSKGWIRGLFENRFGYCMEGALIQAERNLILKNASCLEDFSNAKIIIQRRINCGIMSWNDDICESKEEALEVLAGAISDLS